MKKTKYKKRLTFEKLFDIIFTEYFKNSMELLEVKFKDLKIRGVHYIGPNEIEIKIQGNNIKLKKELESEFKNVTPMEILNFKPELINSYFKEDEI